MQLPLHATAPKQQVAAMGGAPPGGGGGVPASGAGAPASGAGARASGGGTPASGGGTPASGGGTPASGGGRPASAASLQTSLRIWLRSRVTEPFRANALPLMVAPVCTVTL